MKTVKYLLIVALVSGIALCGLLMPYFWDHYRTIMVDIFKAVLFVFFCLTIAVLIFYLKRNPSQIEHQGRENKYKYPKN